MATWRELIAEEAENNGDDITNLYCTLSQEEMDVDFDPGYGQEEGKMFTAWTENYVYFPVVYDGQEWCGSAPRHPCDKPTRHQGQ